jgi:alpha,alpha-trehalase
LKPAAVLLAGLLLLAAACAAPGARTAGSPAQPRPVTSDPLASGRIEPLRAYIRRTWGALTRTLRDLPRAAADEKIPRAAGAAWPVYVAAGERARVEGELRAALAPAALATIDLRTLPAEPASVREHGLLYLPRPYLVPGGRFNEMYGWDSYFIVLGLIDDGEIARARDLVDDFLYEVVRYGGVLNANRTYYLTRSQPPLLSEMVLAVFRATGDAGWLAAARPAIEAQHRHWTAPPHLFEGLGLSRYYDHGEGPAPEVVGGERDPQGRTHYDRVRAYFRDHREQDGQGLYYRRADDALTPLFYKGDRSMRESGFDPSGRFGPFGAGVIRYAPVCLNTLLYQMELDLAEIDGLLGRPGGGAAWSERARARHAAIDRLLWDEGAGLYLDYDVETGRRRRYLFATTFWPLWAGLASEAQARRVRDSLPLLERPGGLMTSAAVTGDQWDAPFGWAPLQLFAVAGLRRAGFAADADRIARAFLSMLVEDFERRSTLVEKYDVARRTSDVAGALAFGYLSNEIGFGWTNGVALELLRGLR